MAMAKAMAMAMVMAMVVVMVMAILVTMPLCAAMVPFKHLVQKTLGNSRYHPNHCVTPLITIPNPHPHRFFKIHSIRIGRHLESFSLDQNDSELLAISS